jgi:hypothetical protein
MQIPRTPRVRGTAAWIGLALVVLVCWLLIRWLGTGLGLVITAPFFAFWVAYWAADGWREALWWLRWLKWRSEHGHHHVFHNQPVTLRKMGGKVWIRLADIQAIVGEPVNDVARRRLISALGADRFHCQETSVWWVREDALLEWLQRIASVQHRQIGRLHHWLAREALRSEHANGLMRLPSL